MSDMERLLQQWDGHAVVTHFDRPTGTWVFIAIHDMTLGPALGGCRLRMYDSPADGLHDAMRLAEGMTHKWAVIGFPYGGGKTVMAVGKLLDAEEREGLFRRYGRLLQSLGGCYAAGEDLGTTPADMAVVAEETEFAHGLDRATGDPVDPGPYTALGVFTAIRTALQRAYGSPRPTGRTVLVQGMGDVGWPLAKRLKEEGAAVLAADTDAARLRRAVAELGCVPVEADHVYATPCDVYAPCAVGATLNERTVPLLQCRVVAGSANNQLEAPEVAEALHARGILYAPDYVVNAGGAIALPMLHRGAREGEVRIRVEGIGETLAAIFAEAAERGESPVHAARRRVERVLEAARPARDPVPA